MGAAMKITIYTRPGCVQCSATTNFLDRKGVAYELIDISNQPEVLGRLLGGGYKSLPVVFVNDGRTPESWSGFRPDLLKRL